MSEEGPCEKDEGEKGRSNVCGGEGPCEKDQGGEGEDKYVRWRGCRKKNEGTNLSTQFSSFLSLHSIRKEPPNTPCEKSINQSSHSTSCQGAAHTLGCVLGTILTATTTARFLPPTTRTHTHILDVCWAPSSQPPPPPDSCLPPPESELSIFQQLPLRIRKGNYAADHMQKNKHSDLKLSYDHPSLSQLYFVLMAYTMVLR